MLPTHRRARVERTRARLDALAPRWVPTAEGVQAELAGESAQSDSSGPPTPQPVVRSREPRGLLALGLCGVGAVVGGALVWWLALPSGSALPEVVGAPAPAPARAAAASPMPAGTSTLLTAVPSGVGSTTSPSASSVVVVDVKGRVRRPGVVELPVGSRVIDALDAAGGVTARGSTDGLNLAAVLTDGVAIVVLGPGQAAGLAPLSPGSATIGAAPSAGGTSMTGPIDLNAATLEQLDTLPGIGPVLAERILQWRAEHGRFSSVTELQEVSGIGDATFSDLEPLVRV